MKILLTGKSGFIGSHIFPFCKEVGSVDCLVSDLRDHKAVNQEIALSNPDIVIHLAARTEVEQSFYEQTTFSDINYTATVNLLESCQSLKKMPYFVFASTMEVYGWQPISDEIKFTGTYSNSVAFDENTIPNPNAPYAVAKYGCEKYIEYFGRTFGMPYTIIRQTNSYGRKDNDFFVTEQIISQMLKNDEVNLGYSDPYRNFIFIDDLLEVWKIIITNQSKVQGNLFTIGPDDPRKIQDCANLIANKLNFKGKINWNTKPNRPGEIYWLNSSNKKITDLTGWYPKTSYTNGIDKTIEIWNSLINKI